MLILLWCVTVALGTQAAVCEQNGPNSHSHPLIPGIQSTMQLVKERNWPLHCWTSWRRRAELPCPRPEQQPWCCSPSQTRSTCRLRLFSRRCWRRFLSLCDGTRNSSCAEIPRPQHFLQRKNGCISKHQNSYTIKLESDALNLRESERICATWKEKNWKFKEFRWIESEPCDIKGVPAGKMQCRKAVIRKLEGRYSLSSCFKCTLTYRFLNL